MPEIEYNRCGTMPTRIVSLLPSATELIWSVLDQHERDVENMDDVDDGSAILVGRACVMFFFFFECMTCMKSGTSIRSQSDLKQSATIKECTNNKDAYCAGSHECDYPEKTSKLPALTSSTIRFTTSADVDRQVRDHLETGNGLYSVDSALLSELAPDVIVTQSLCKVCSVDFCAVERLVASVNASTKPTLVDTNPQDLFEVLQDIVRVGQAIGMEKAAMRARQGLERRIEQVTQYVHRLGAGEDRTDLGRAKASPSVAMMEWTDPIFIGGHWTPQIIHMAGGRHALNMPKQAQDGSDKVMGAGPSFTVAPEELAAYDPDILIIAPCGLDLPSTIRETKRLLQKPWWPGLTAVQSGNVWLVDGNRMFNRPSARLVDALEWLCWIFHGMKSNGALNFPATKISSIAF